LYSCCITVVFLLYSHEYYHTADDNRTDIDILFIISFIISFILFLSLWMSLLMKMHVKHEGILLFSIITESTEEYSIINLQATGIQMMLEGVYLWCTTDMTSTFSSMLGLGCKRGEIPCLYFINLLNSLSQQLYKINKITDSMKITFLLKTLLFYLYRWVSLFLLILSFLGVTIFLVFSLLFLHYCYFIIVFLLLSFSFNCQE
jgi:hypothetical protein